MTFDDLRALADEYFEWPIAHNKSTVTLTSALLFAKHVLEMHEKSLEMHEKSLGTENSAGVDALPDDTGRDWSLLEATQKSLREHMAIIQKHTALLRQALEALENPHAGLVPHNGYWCSIQSIAMTALRAALEQQAEPEPEPVAWMCPEDPERETAFSWKAGHCENCGKQRIPLYAAPPQRKPLTDAEIEKLFGGAVADVPRAHWLRQAAIEVVRKTERAHGIGEEYVAESAST